MLRSTSSCLSVVVAALLSVSACDKGPQGGENDPAKANAAKVTTGKAAAKAKPPVVKTLDGKVYGKKITEATSVPISEIIAHPEKYEGKTVRVEGLVTDVCPRRGCWMNLAGDKPGQKMRFKVRDGVIVIPMKAKGNYAVAQGVVRVKKLSLEQTQNYLAHMAEEKGEKFDKSTVTKPKLLVMLDGQGAVIRDRK